MVCNFCLCLKSRLTGRHYKRRYFDKMVRHAFCADVKKMFFASVHFKRNTFTLEFHSMIKDKKNTQNKNGFHLCVKKHQ